MNMERINSLDLLRGFAVLGILLMNIVSFGLPISAYINPTAYGEFSGSNQWVWAAMHLLADQKFISLFAALFGAGIVLFAQRAAARQGAATGLHYRRMGWLVLFGLIHGWLLWYGDVLFVYALTGMLVFLMRNLRLRWLLTWAAVFYAIPMLLALMTAGFLSAMPEADRAAIADMWAPDRAQLQAEIAAMTGSFAEQFSQRGQFSFMMQTQLLLLDYLWRAAGLMLLGMALFRSGVITGAYSSDFYRRLSLLLIPGWIVVLVGMQQKLAHGFSLEQSMFIDAQFNYLASPLIMLGYMALVILWLKSGRLAGLQDRLRAVGKTAFSCYIMHTLIGVLLFNVFGLFGQLDRLQLLLIVLSIWVLQLYLAPWYLQHFRQGPLEALWRRLTYGRGNGPAEARVQG